MKHSLSLLAVLYTGLACAHSPYLLPNKFDLAKRDHVSVQASFTEDFLIPDIAMKADDYHVIMPDGSKVAVTPVYTRDLAVLDVATPQDGTYRISTGDRLGRMAKMAHMRDGEWKFFEGAAPEGGEVHEMQSIARADAFVARGSPNDKALASTNKGLELQFLAHPNKLLAGSALKVRVIYDGKPVPNQLLTIRKAALEAGAAPAPVELRCGADGSASIPLAVPGIYHVMARNRFALDGADAKAQSHTYAVTLEVTE